MFGSRLSPTAARLAFCGLLVVAAQALAFAPAPQNSGYEIPLLDLDLHGHHSFAVDQARVQTVTALEGRYGGNWHVYSWNPQTRTPAITYGTPVDMASAVSGPAQLEQLARQAMAANPEIFRVAADDLALSATPNAKGKWVAHFQQKYAGLDVWQGRAMVAFSEDGNLILMGSELHDGIDLDPNPLVGEASAVQIARMALPFNPGTDSVEPGRDLLVLPVPVSESEASYHLVWRVRVHTEDPLGIWVTHVDAHTGEIVWRYNDVHFAYSGDSDSEAQEDTWCNGVSNQAMPYLDVTVTGAGSTTTDADGDWSVAGSNGQQVVGAELYGPYCDITNAGGPEAEYGAFINPDEPHTIIFGDLQAQHDERDVFDGVNDIHDFFQVVDPGFNLPHTRMSAVVSRVGGLCPGNAWWNGTINFCAASGSYSNTGEIQGVVHHEYGHGIQAAILGWQGNQGLGEGNGDIIANLMTQEALIGRGFYANNCNSGIRNSNNNLQYPDDVIGQEIHFAGQVIAGFHWDAMEVLQDAYGVEAGTWMTADTWHYGRELMHPTTQPAQVFATFFADDDNGNLDDGTPNYAAYCVGASNHGFDCPDVTEGVLVDHQPLDDTDDTSNPYAVTADLVSTFDSIDPSSVGVYYRHGGGGWSFAAMAPAGGDTYTGQIPAQDVGLVEYYVYGEDMSGNEGTSPIGAPVVVHEFNVAWLVDPTEGAGAWTSGDPGDTATGGFWENVDPIGTIAQPEDDHTTDGTMCWVTGQHTPGQPAGYNDVDGGTTTLYSPVWDLSAAESYSVSLWYWWSDNLGGGGGDIFFIRASNDGGAGYSIIATVLDSPNEWRNATFSLENQFPGQDPGQLRLKFSAADNSTDSLVEALVDDVVILADMGTTGTDDGLTVGFPTDLAQNHPNPFNPKTEIRFQLENQGHATLRVYDAAGRLVTELVNGSLDSGEHRVVWNGVDAGGSPVASGVYLYQLQTAGKTQSRRMVLIK